jgi:hypothetical protein
MSMSFSGRVLTINGQSIQLDWPIRDAMEDGERVFVLLNPDSYLLDSDYRKARDLGTTAAIRNLIAFGRGGEKLWEAEMPEFEDCYHMLHSSDPLVATSFSCYRCQIDVSSGAILSRVFLK